MTTTKLPEITITSVWDGDSLNVDATADVSEYLRLIHTAGITVQPDCPAHIRDQVEKYQIERALRGLIFDITSNKESA